MKKRLSLLDLHKTGIKKQVMGKIQGGADIKCLCTFTNPLVGTRETSGPNALCICTGNSASVSSQVQTTR